MRREGIWALCSFFTVLILNYWFSGLLSFERWWPLYLVANACPLVGVSSLRNNVTAVLWRAAVLGAVFGFGLILTSSLPSASPLSIFAHYLLILSFFHWSEYVCTAATNPRALNLDSFLLNHSNEYWIALAAGCLEYFLELYIFPSMKTLRLVSSVGVLMCIVGEVLRKLAMVTAGRGFTHLIAYRKKPEHELVTTGIYSLFRHPSYVGWFWWSIGTQIVLCNPLCTIAYSIVSWMFFRDRIFHEEMILINFFGEHYVNYQNRVPTGLPGIKGYQLI